MASEKILFQSNLAPEGFTCNGNGQIIPVVVETTTTLNPNGDATFTYTSEDGTVVTISLCDLVGEISNLGNNAATGDLVLVRDPGTGTCELKALNYAVDVNVDNFTYDPVTNTITLTETDGTVHNIDISDLVDVETITTLVNNADGTFSYTSEDGTVTTISFNNSSVTQVVTGQEIATHDDGNGNVTSIQETVTTMVDNGDGTYTFTSEDGTTTILPAEVITTLTNTLAAGNLIGTYTNEDGTVTNILESVTSLTYDIATGLYTFTHEDGSTSTIDVCQVIDNQQPALDCAYFTGTGVPAIQ